MKKIFLGLVISAFIFNACEKLDPISVVVTPSAAEESTLSVMERVMTFSVQNKGQNPAVIQWDRVGILEPAGFTYTVNGDSSNWGKMTLEPFETWDFTFTINPNGNMGTATGNIVFVDLASPDETVQNFSYNVTTEANLFEIAPVGSMSRSANAAIPTDYYIDIINGSLSPVTVNWRRDTAQNNSPGWTSAIAVEDQYALSPAYFDGVMHVPSKDTVRVEVKMDPNGNVGSGGVNMIFFIPIDSANSHRNQLVSHVGTL